MSSINEFYTASRPYYHEALTFCVQTKQQIPIWKNLFLVCSDPLVYVVGAIAGFLGICTIYFMQQFEDLQPKWDWHRITLIMFANVSGFSYNSYNPQTIPYRIYHIITLFCAIIITNFISSFMLLLLTTPIYENQIESIQEIVDNQFEVISDTFALQHLKLQNQVYFQYFSKQII